MQNLLGLSLGGGNTWMFVILGVFLVLMIVMSVIPQRKQKKKQEEMMNSIQVGSKIMTIGGLIGVITEYDPSTDYYTINVGTPSAPNYIIIVKNAIRTKLDDSTVVYYEPPKAEKKDEKDEIVDVKEVKETKNKSKKNKTSDEQ